MIALPFMFNHIFFLFNQSIHDPDKYLFTFLCFQGIPGQGKFRRAEDIIMVCTSIIFTCSVQHAAVNFPQYNEYAFPPNYPSVLNKTPPVDRVSACLCLLVPCMLIIDWFHFFLRLLNQSETLKVRT